MRPNAAWAASGRLAGALSALCLLLSGALAGDRALLDVIGFSQDKRYFAFEEFGIQDGSGFPFANIYVVDLEADAWVAGTPIRVRFDDEQRDLLEARLEAQSQALSTLVRREINLPADTLAVIGDGIAGDSGKLVIVGVPGYERGTTHSDYKLALETFETSSTLTCQDWFGSVPLGMSLTLEDPEGNIVEIHRDGALPQSRGCPFDYRLYGVFLPMHSQNFFDAVAIVSVYPGGFEGPDRRFIAVPLRP